jgi:hypothetical protein
MPSKPLAAVQKSISIVRGVDALMEEVYIVGALLDPDRALVVPPGASVTFKHEMSHPPFFWQTRLNQGLHTFLLRQGWNKFKVRLESPETATVEWRL